MLQINLRSDVIRWFLQVAILRFEEAWNKWQKKSLKIDEDLEVIYHKAQRQSSEHSAVNRCWDCSRFLSILSNTFAYILWDASLPAFFRIGKAGNKKTKNYSPSSFARQMKSYFQCLKHWLRNEVRFAQVARCIDRGWWKIQTVRVFCHSALNRSLPSGTASLTLALKYSWL